MSLSLVCVTNIHACCLASIDQWEEDDYGRRLDMFNCSSDLVCMLHSENVVVHTQKTVQKS